ncbi:MAG: HAD-IA family hydrolase [Clostridia bacterium]|nr:HAD-IA family hydrolase [Clostridia bacterium]
MKYRHIIFDADHTLIDFNEDERRAFRAAFKGTPMESEEIIEAMWKFSYENWSELGLNNVNNPDIRKKYHALYYVHIHALFEHAKKEYDLENADEAEKIFYRVLCSPSHPREGAFETVKELAKRYAVSIATNGLSEMQHARLKDFMPYLDRLFISEEMNAIKPSREFGNIMLNELGANAEECLFIGDSLTSDIALANKLKMDCVWYDPEGRSLPEGYSVVKKISSLSELINL